jgi:hypothetical protein
VRQIGLVRKAQYRDGLHAGATLIATVSSSRKKTAWASSARARSGAGERVLGVVDVSYFAQTPDGQRRKAR